ncbi:MAG: SAF domain-containing protein [Myxococcota bacterium]|jgi:hypothetical protein
MDQSRRESLPDGVTFGIAFGGTVLVLSVLSAALALAWATKKGADARRGWNLVVVARVTRDLQPGAVLTAGDVVQGELPEMFVTPGVVGPAQLGSVLGRRLQVPLHEGDVLWRSHFEPMVAACPGLVRQSATSEHVGGDPDVAAFVDEVTAAVKARESKEAR